MPSQFPGMNPYLEDSEHWRSFHHLLADEIMAQLNAVLSAKYFADVEIRTLLEEVTIGTTASIYPDAGVVEVNLWGRPQATVAEIPAAPIQRVATTADQVKQRSVHVYETDGRSLVTAIELLSPGNKRGDGLQEYRQKRSRILRSSVHLIEIDLLRAGIRPGWEVNEPPIDTDYVLLLNRGQVNRDRISEIWPVAINESLPVLPVPLLPGDADVPLHLKEAIDALYVRGAYVRRIDYSKPIPAPSPRNAIAGWLIER